MINQKSYNAEYAIVGILLGNYILLEEIVGEIKFDDFFDYELGTIYKAMNEMRVEGNVADITTLAFAKHKMLGGSESEVYVRLASIWNQCCASPANLKAYGEIVKKESIRRKTTKIIEIGIAKIRNGDEDYLEYFKEKLSDMENSQSYEIKTYKQLLDETIDKLEEDCKNSKGITGISTGFIDLDNFTNGLQPGNMIILAARPSQGKTMLMLNIADHIGNREKQSCVVISLEQPGDDICKRTISRVSKVMGDSLFKAQLNEEDWGKIGRGINLLHNSKVFVCSRSCMTVFDIRAFCRKVRNMYGLKAVFIDYIGQIQGGNIENETLRIANISRELKMMAMDFDIPVFVLCQLNRQIETRPDRRPKLSDIRQSGNIEQDADVVIFLESREYEATLYVEKNRNGRVGELKLSLSKQFFEFRNYAS